MVHSICPSTQLHVATTTPQRQRSRAFIRSNKCLAPHQMKTMSSAVRWYDFAVRLNFTRWTENERFYINTLLKCRARGGPAVDVRILNRGAIVYDMVDPMLNWLHSDGHASLAMIVALRLCFGHRTAHQPDADTAHG